MNRSYTTVGIGIALALLITLAGVIGAWAVLIPALEEPHTNEHASTSATIDGDTMTIELTHLRNATHVSVSVADGYGTDPQHERRAGNLTTVGDTMSVPMTNTTTVLVRSIADSKHVVTNVYRLHTDTGKLVDLHQNYPAHLNVRNPSAELAVEAINNTSYRVTWVETTPGFHSASYSDWYHPSHQQADELQFSNPESTSDGDEIVLSKPGDSTIIRYYTYEDEYGYEKTIDSWTVVGVFNGKRSVIGALDEDDFRNCSMDSEQFDTNGASHSLYHCRNTD